MKTVYALLIGIDNYRAPVPALRGCGNDVCEVRAFLKAMVAHGSDQNSGEALQVVTLLNQQATRTALIDGFRSHLIKAGPKDVALCRATATRSCRSGLPRATTS